MFGRTPTLLGHATSVPVFDVGEWIATACRASKASAKIIPRYLRTKELTMTETATFGAGCFWGIEANFRRIPGVVDAAVGYSGGHTANPTYKDVCTDETGHAEVVQVSFDPAKVSYDQLLDAFWNMHDPTQMNRQGPDFGSQYRTAIFYHSPEQKAAAEKAKAAAQASGKFRRPIATEITAAGPFYRAEEYHQRYLEKRGAAACHF
jgi:peptide-methionine (S)-S-oxide reductase